MKIDANVSYLPKRHVHSHDVLQELSNYMLVDGYNFVLDFEKSSGSYLYELRTGKKYIDFFSFFASVPIGLNHPKMNSNDFIDHIGKIALNKPSNSDFYSEEMAAFVKTFFNVAVPDYFKYSFFIDGGALAVENALKTAFDWKVRKNFAKGYKEEKGNKVIHFRQAFHGRTGYTMSLTNTDPNKINYFPKFDWPRIINPKIQFPLNEKNLELTIKAEEEAINDIRKAFIVNQDDIAAIIIEPIQGEGGDNHFRPQFLKSLRDLADEYEALLIFDEVQTGVGLTGKWWAHENHEIKPDIMTFGKKMQVCGILVSDRIDDVDDHVFRKSSRINSTWGGNLTDMVRATRYLEIIEEEKLVENAANMGKVLLSELKDIEIEFPKLISSPRGVGLFCAFDIIPEKRQSFLDKCEEEGLLILPCGSKSIRFRPALNIEEGSLIEGLDIIKNVLKELK